MTGIERNLESFLVLGLNLCCPRGRNAVLASALLSHSCRLSPKRVGSYFKSRRPDPRPLFFLSQLRVVFARGGFLPVVENIGPAPLVHPQISAGPPVRERKPARCLLSE